MPDTILGASDRQQSLQFAREYRPSLVYLALDIPHMDCVACCRDFKQDPVLQNIPVILIGDCNQPTHQSLVRAEGCDSSLGKPLDRRRILDVGHSFLYSIERS